MASHSNLDASSLRYAPKLFEKFNTVGITTVYVTHDQEEAMAISRRIAVMKDGIINKSDDKKNSIINQLMSLWQPYWTHKSTDQLPKKRATVLISSSRKMAMPYTCTGSWSEAENKLFLDPSKSLQR